MGSNFFAIGSHHKMKINYNTRTRTPQWGVPTFSVGNSLARNATENNKGSIVSHSTFTLRNTVTIITYTSQFTFRNTVTIITNTSHHIRDELDQRTKTPQEVMINNTFRIHHMCKINQFNHSTQTLPLQILLLLIHHKNRTGIEMINSLNLKPPLQLQKLFQRRDKNLSQENTIRVSITVRRNKLPQNQLNILSRETLKAFFDVFVGMLEVPSSGTDLDIDNGGIGVTGDEVFQDEVRAQSGAIGSVNELSTMEKGEESSNVLGNAGIEIERGVKSEFVVATVIALKRFVELSRIVYERAKETVLRSMTSDLVFWDPQHFLLCCTRLMIED
ncbi:hypothetical protein SESBI_22530 [Sesbania bispinosa]|nr:hypothetical protein SESBI_22530 [Sesbania bispinosa]